MTNYEKAKELLEKHNQGQIFAHYEDLSEEEKQELINQILDIDFDLIGKLYSETQGDVKAEAKKVEPIAYTEKAELSEEKKEQYKAIGEEVLRQGKYAVVTMAGGQGTRLGHDGPKGTFDMGLPSGKSLFEIFCDKIKDASKKYNAEIPWYIMTSRQNDEETKAFFKEKGYFGYPENAIKFFIQGELPMLNESGQILLEEKHVIKAGADGHGGILAAMEKNNITEDMKAKGVEWFVINGIDNPLIGIIDPVFIGITLDEKLLSSSKSTAKARPEEKVGVFCKKNGRPSVIEYIEISEEMAHETDENGKLVYADSNIVCHLFNINEFEKIMHKKLPYKAAHKKTSYIDEEGNLQEPDGPNSYKFEAFIFDAFEMLEDMIVFRVKREDEFAPIKNASGEDSPETARKLYTEYFKREGN